MSDPAPAARHPMLVIMGVSGSGKSTVGDALATRMGWPYTEGDAFHPQANIAKMAAGKPLDDADRQPWLAAIADWMDVQAQAKQPGVIGCSALKRRYRDFLRKNRPQVWFLYLRVPRGILQRRLETRHHEYMPPSLLDSQLATLEEPASDEPRCIALDAADGVQSTLAAALQAVRTRDILPCNEGMG
ncbi:MAG TPA: gluconokinase [Rhodanobacteraceae bacterium]|nr:gluconokinase [Rhodanobacteraceae bacterium]